MVCSQCGGSGGLYSFVNGVERDAPCSRCSGTGEVFLPVPDFSEEPEGIVNELRPCPFCGEEAEIESESTCGVFIPGSYYAQCTKCELRTPKYYEDKASVIEYWNTRPDEDFL